MNTCARCANNVKLSSATCWLAVVVCASFARAQQAPWPQVSQIDSSDVHFACNIREVAFVYRKSSLALPRAEKRNFKAIAERDIHRISTPNEALVELFDYAIGYKVSFNRDFDETRLRTEQVADVPFRLWHGVWSLFPTEGGSTGTPFQYHAFVRPDGKRILPEIYFCDFATLAHERYFSALPFQLIEFSIEKECITADTALLAAQAALRDYTELIEAVRLRQILLRELPFARAAWGKTAFVYEIEYSITDNSDLREDGNPFSLWVTTDGTCSTVSKGHWVLAEIPGTAEANAPHAGETKANEH